jgi:peptidoglycan/xylan/chitin deacetylase (PgdA/CDA1 family)
MSDMIFNFHGVGPVPRALDPGESDCWLERGAFEAILDLLKGYPNARITVDDGNVSDFTHILPALIMRGQRARFFICSGRLEDPSFLSRHQIRGLLAEGMGIGSHGVRHRPWRDISPQELSQELASSRGTLEETCGVRVDEAACPFGSYDRKVLAALRRAGYRRVYTSDGGASGGNSWIMPRTTVTRQMSLDEIRRLVTAGPGIATQMLIHTKRLCKRLL